MVRRLIFDIDGTLITEVDFSSFITNALRNYGINNLEKTKQFLSGIKEYEMQYNCYNKEYYLDFFSKKLDIKLNNDFLDIFWNELKSAIPKNSENIKSVLSSLDNYELVLLSNYFEQSQRNRLMAMGINNYFTEYYGEKIIKPNIDAYKSAAGIYNPDECVIIGDDKKLDIDIPKSLGFKTIFINENGDIKTIEQLSPSLIEKL